MKKIQNKTYSFFGIIIIIVFAIGVVSFANAQVKKTVLGGNEIGSSFANVIIPSGHPGASIKPLIHAGAGEQAIAHLKVGNALSIPGINNVQIDVRSNNINQESKFTGKDSLFATVFNTWFSDTLFIGIEDESQLPSHWVNPITTIGSVGSQLGKVNVSGDVLVSQLANNAGNANVCVDAYGRIKLCAGILGVCGSSAGQTLSSAPSTNLCSTGLASSVITNATTYDWTCSGQNGGAHVSCSANIEVGLTYAWNTGSWGSCTTATCAGTYVTGGNPTVESSGPFATCFVSDTQVTMADGSTKNIQDVVIGDILKGETSNNTVLAFHQPKLGKKKLYSFNDGNYFVTAEHPFMTTEGWKAFDPELALIEHNLDIEIQQLNIGDILVTENGNIVLKTVDTKTDNENTQLYNFILDGDRTYYADHYLVHNKIQCDTSSGLNCGSSTCVDWQGNASSIGTCSFSCSTPGQALSSSSCPISSGNNPTGAYCGFDKQKHCLYNGDSVPYSNGASLQNCAGPTNVSSCIQQSNTCNWLASEKTRIVTCEDSNGVNVVDQFCIDNVGARPNVVTTADCQQPQPKYAWDIGGWGLCQSSKGGQVDPVGSVKLRIVLCRDDNSALVNDSLCPSPKPATSEAC